VVKAAEWVDWIYEYDDYILLLDIGESFFQGGEPEKLAQPRFLRVPETIVTDSLDYRVDSWRVGCMVCQLGFSHVLQSRYLWMDVP
jgi:serine/threonine-protein kinase SRPK3